MSVDMSQFYQTFFEESVEGLDEMESCLLNLDVGQADSETVNTIFRAAHSIKGGSATFGFAEVAKFTHVMETLLDEMRSGERLVTQEAVDLLLKSVDILRAMLTATQEGQAIEMGPVTGLQSQLEALLGADASPEASDNGSTNTSANQNQIWNIHFKPHEHLLRTGNDPARIIKELKALGELEIQVNISALPHFKDIEPSASYLFWDFQLTDAGEGKASKEAIDEIFNWVEDDCDLQIIAQENSSVDSVQANTEIPASPESMLVATSSSEAQASSKGNPEPKTPVKEPVGKKASADSGSIRVSIDKVDALINMVGELVITQSMLGQFGETFEMDQIEKLRDGLVQLERNTRELQENVMRIRMLPISFAFQRFPRVVRDLSQQLGKQVELQLAGEQTELDKTVMEKIGDPLVHLVRNSVDHGIELPEIRKAAGKPEKGHVKLDAYHQGGNVIIEIVDDGAGINKDKVLEKAKERGLVNEYDKLSDEQIFDLVFHPGFSTADVVSDVSGRGVGMDVVKRNIRELGGSILVKSEPEKGSTFTIKLPLTLAILDGQLVTVGGETYIIPLVSIIESLQVKKDQVSAIAGTAELYKLRNEYIPVVRLYDLFHCQPISENLEDGLLVVVEGDGQHIGLYVDDLQGQQQVVIKSLETNYRSVEGVSGATILGDGTVALILDITDLIKLSRTIQPGQALDRGMSHSNSQTSNASLVEQNPQATNAAA